ncbi:mitotic-spindle organizing protein 2-like [Uloborus diversus]|uniref:mitotic-spindle organizing protein 2-like n=1 Tax=Uloborus diversus TaxID=327109 RepID=UPI00240968C5|nr:mitotic-spindle organizing protein 2-like [Uloborus diversus]
MTGANQFPQNTAFHSSVQSALSNRDIELYELACLSGVAIDPQVFRILLELLKMDISPTEIFRVLQSMAHQAFKPNTALKKNSQNKSHSSQNPSKKKPPVAAKPKKISVEKQGVY